MTSSQLGEHAGYLGDEVKLAAYEKALQAKIAEHGGVVLDLGSGSGILGLLAARAGARRVYAVDSGPILGAASEVAKAAGFDEVVVAKRGLSTRIDLDEQADVAVCDQIGGFVYEAGVLEYFADARRRLLRPGAALVPEHFRLYLAPVEHPELREQLDLWSSRPAGFDFSAFRRLAVNTEHRVAPEDIRLLGAGAEVAAVAADHTDPIKGDARVTIEAAGRLDGLVGWFEADLGGGAVLTNRPDAPDRMRRWCNVYPFDAGTEVAPGDEVAFTVDVRPLLGAVTWRIAVRLTDGRPEVRETASTVQGGFIDVEELARARGAPLELTGLGLAVSRALSLTDGSRSRQEIVDEVLSGLPEAEGASIKQALANYVDGLSATT